jgi:flavin reductase (DIM6/NTAB) family NADH-FMN oxidoreductase RutF
LTLADDLEPNVLREVFGHYPSGIAALCSLVDGSAEGMVASTFTVGVSLEPPLVMFAARNSSLTWPLLRRSTRIGVSILSSGQEDVCRQLAAKTGDRFAGVDVTTAATGAVFLNDAGLWLECSLESESPAGDHTVALLRVHGHEARANGPDPLIFHGSAFRSLLVPSFA